MSMDKMTMRVMNKLFEKGYVTEKSIIGFSLEDMRKAGLHSKEELDKMLELIEAVKKNKMISFLAGESENFHDDK
ncbi:hypothetical protein NE604_00580 [Anaerofustis stercorihominis]|uniref:hypothetical protein n=1 Tax=Anaerofustis stercorihominis TaxID=214853 RepID=UPI0021090376|nr:hypothetical protein [Anaerofustis stercorihominis]MCQ4794143.1 hypothetical protein [Anaerofustis stercorihominis]